MGKLITTIAKYLWQVLLNLYAACQRWQKDDAGLLAAGVAFYATISMVPLLLVLVAGLGLFMRYTSLGWDAQLDLLVAIEDATSSEVAESVNMTLEQVQEQAVVGGPLGMIGLIIAAMAVFSRFERALERIWKTERRKRINLLGTALDLALDRIKAFASLLGLGLVVLAIFGTGMAFSAVSKFNVSRFPIWEGIWQASEIGVGVILDAFVFGSMYRLLGRSKIDWRRALRGGLLAAVTWEIGRLVVAEFLIDDRYSTYGMVGSLLVLMLWAYYATSVLLLGAEYVQVIREREVTALRIFEPAEDDDAADRLGQLEAGFRRWRPRPSRSKAA